MATKILLVDDNKAFLGITKATLEGLNPNYKITAVTSAQEALSRLLEKDYDLMIADYRMPQKSGLDLLTILRTDGNEIPFILLTGQGHESIAMEALNRGADYYCRKRALKSMQIELQHIIQKILDQKDAEIENLENIIMLQRVLEVIPEAVFFWEKRSEGEIVLGGANDLAFECLGIGHLPILEMSLEQVYKGYPQLVSMVKQAFKTHLRPGQAEFFLPDSETEDQAWFVADCSLVNDELALVVAREITERKKAEEKVRKRNIELEMLNHIISVSSTAINLDEVLPEILLSTLSLLDFDGGGIYLTNFGDRRAELRYHYGLPEEFIEEVNLISIDEQPYRTLFLKGEPIITENYPSMSSRQYPVEWGLLSLASIPLIAKNKVIGALNVASKKQHHFSDEEINILQAIGREAGTTISRGLLEEKIIQNNEKLKMEIKERKETELALREREQRFRALFEKTNDAVFIIDLNGTHREVNQKAAEMLGYEEHELVGMSIYQIVAEDEHHTSRELQERLADGQSLPIYQRHFRKKDGTLFPVEVNVAMVLNAAGNAMHIQSIVRDITERKKAENALRESEETFRRSFDALPDPAFLWKKQANGKLILSRINKAAIDLSSDKISQLQGREIHKLLSNSGIMSSFKHLGMDLEAIFQKVQDSLLTGNRLRTDIIIKMPNGEQRWLNANFVRVSEDIVLTFTQDWTERLLSEAVMQNARDKLERLVNNRTSELVLANKRLEQEISDRIAAELEVQQQADFLTTVIESLSHPFYVLDVKDYTVKMANAAASNEPLSVDSKCFAFAHNRNSPCKELNSQCPLEEIKRTKQPTVVEHLHFDKENKARIYEVHAYPILDDEKNVQQMIEYSIDITERKKTEEALKKSEIMYQDLYNSAPVAYLSIGAEGRIKNVNRAAENLLGYQLDELRRIKILDLYAEESKAKAKQLFQKFRRGDSWKNEEMIYLKKNGEKAYCLLSVSPIKDAYGQVQESRSVIVDISHRKQMEHHLVIADKMASLGRVVAGVAHEINNPLSFVLLNTEALQQHLEILRSHVSIHEDLEKEILHGNLSKVKDIIANKRANEQSIEINEVLKDLSAILNDNMHGLTQMAKIVQDLRLIGRTTKDETEKQACDVNEILERTLSLIKYEKTKSIAIKRQLGDLPIIWGSPNRLSQAFMNLLVNAVQAIDQEGIIDVIASLASEGIEIRVRDTGKGIPSEHLQKIFDPFFTTKKASEGTGLGLAITYEIINGHGGEISVQSEEGKGTEFIIVLPLSSELEATETQLLQ